MKRPSFQFYPADWRNNAKLRRCSEAARGAWMDILCVLHDLDEYGVCRWPLADLARASNISIKLIKELVSKEVLKGADAKASPFIFTPRHAGKDGDPVTLVEHKDGPVWYCSRLVRDEYIRQKRGQSTRFDESTQPPKPTPNKQPKPTIGDDFGYGSTSSSTSSSENKVKTNVRTSSARFPEFWSLWPNTPRKVGKSACEKKWKAKNLDSIAELIIQHVTEIKKTKTWTDGFEPSPMTYINQGRWSDEIFDGVGTSATNTKPWFISSTGIEAKALEIGIEMQSGEGFPAFKVRVYKEAGITQDMVRQAAQDFA